MKKHNFPEFVFKNTDKIEYRVIWKAPAKSLKADGLCDDPSCKKPEVWINPKLKERRFIEVLTEELIHAHIWDKNEKTVRKLAYNLTKILIKVGFKLKQ